MKTWLNVSVGEAGPARRVGGCGVLALGLLSSVVFASSAAAADSAASSSFEVSLARSGSGVFRGDVRLRIGGEAVVGDARQRAAAKRIHSERTDRGVRLLVEDAEDAAAGDLIRLTVAEVPGGIAAGSARVLAADGT